MGLRSATALPEMVGEAFGQINNAAPLQARICGSIESLPLLGSETAIAINASPATPAVSAFSRCKDGAKTRAAPASSSHARGRTR